MGVSAIFSDKRVKESVTYTKVLFFLKKKIVLNTSLINAKCDAHLKSQTTSIKTFSALNPATTMLGSDSQLRLELAKGEGGKGDGWEGL
jgi:hypothetical protein